ncbi:hypothetical protein KI387_004150, partial [Taxus chinensis]
MLQESKKLMGFVKELQEEIRTKDALLEKLQQGEHKKEMPSKSDAGTMTECTVSCSHFNASSHSVSDIPLGQFEKHTKGIGSKLMVKMGFNGTGLGKNAQGDANPIQVEDQHRFAGLGYSSGKMEIGESSKTAEGRQASKSQGSMPLELQDSTIRRNNDK